jgi:hypothetical protein
MRSSAATSSSRIYLRASTVTRHMLMSIIFAREKLDGDTQIHTL